MEKRCLDSAIIVLQITQFDHQTDQTAPQSNANMLSIDHHTLLIRARAHHLFLQNNFPFCVPFAPWKENVP
jgi:hypothetical protein